MNVKKNNQQKAPDINLSGALLVDARFMFFIRPKDKLVIILSAKNSAPPVKGY